MTIMLILRMATFNKEGGYYGGDDRQDEVRDFVDGLSFHLFIKIS